MLCSSGFELYSRWVPCDKHISLNLYYRESDLFLGHRSFIKTKTQTAVINIVSFRIFINFNGHLRSLLKMYVERHITASCLCFIFDQA